MKPTLILILLICWSTFSVAQTNLVLNPSFEEYSTCDYDLLIEIIQDIIPDWSFAISSPRYFNTECIAYPTSFYYQSNTVIPAFNGTGYVLSVIDLLEPLNSGLANREYFQTQLIQELIPGKNYYLSYAIAFPFDHSDNASHYGVHFMDTLWYGEDQALGSIILDPIIEVDTVVELTTGQWQKMEHCFQVNEPLQVMVLGIFAEPNEITSSSGTDDNLVAYDDFFLAEVEDTLRLNAYRDTICVGECIALSTNHTFFNGTFDWQLPGSDLGSSTDSAVTVCYSQPGTYNIAVEARHCAGVFQNSFQRAVAVMPAPDNYSLDTTICPGQSVQVTVDTAYSVVWEDGSVGQQNTFQDEGVFSFQVNNQGCVQEQQLQIRYSFAPTNQVAEVFACRNDSTRFLGAAYWQPGTYQDTLLSRQGCDSVYYTVQFDYFPDEQPFTDAIFDFCAGDSVTVSSSFQLNNFAWSDGSGLLPRVFTQPQIVSANWISADGCSQSTNLTITENPLPIVFAEDILDQWYEPNLPLPVEYGDEYLSHQWQPSGPLNCADCPFPQLVLPQEGVYTVQVTDANECAAQAELVVRFRTVNVYLPNVIKQNPQRSINGAFFPQSDVDFSYSMQVFDRWGGRLFKGEDLRANDPNQGWKPPSNIIPGTYVFFIEYDENGATQLIKGDFTVLR